MKEHKSYITEAEVSEFKDAMKKTKHMPLPETDSARVTGKQFEVCIEDSGQADGDAGTDAVEYRRPGLQASKLESLRRGKMNTDICLDIHGETGVGARQKLQEFLSEVITIGRAEAVLIIHGKGKNSSQPVLLKNRITAWLKGVPEVLAYVSAKPQDGGAGALYVLLKKNAGR